MTNVYEYACLSGHTYHPDKQYYGGIEFTQTSRKELKNVSAGWNMIFDLVPYMKPSHAVFAALYIKFKNKRPIDAVVAIRGTVLNIKSNDIVDALTWWSDVFGSGQFDKLPMYMGLVSVFVRDCLAFISRNYRSLQLTLTGHSLGGALAQLAVLKGAPLHAIAFNSPGCGNIPKVNLSRHNAIHNINSTYGFINKIGRIVGDAHYVEIPEEEAEAKAMFKQFSKELYHEGSQLESSSSRYNPLTWGYAVVGAELKFLSYYEAAASLGAFVNNKKITEQCVSATHGNFYILTALNTHLCEKIHKDIRRWILLESTIYAQHSIINMIKALKKVRYNSLAHTIY